MVATRLRQTRAAVSAPPFPRSEVYRRLDLAIRLGDKDRARRIYYDEIIPDKRFSRGEVRRLSFRLGAIDEGDRYLSENAGL